MLTTNNRTPISGYSKAKRLLDGKLGESVAPWRIHDLRRTTATFMAEYLGVGESVIEKLLNHASASGGIRGVYQRQEYRDRRRNAMRRWGEYLENLQAGGALAVSTGCELSRAGAQLELAS